jgi:predicted nucleic acid-binding protein
MRAVAWDTWAFLETATEGPRSQEVEDALADAHAVFTVREVVAETFNHLVRVAGRTEPAWRWWNDLAASRVRVFEPPMEDLRAFMGAQRRLGGLSFTDYALAHVAMREGVEEVATEDAEFRRFGLRPLFARR